MKTKKKFQHGSGSGCSTFGELTNMDCIPDVNVSQYKCPCPFLPLDGTKQNVYPLSHNPKANWPVGYNGGKKTKRKRNKKLNKKFQKGGDCSGPSSDCLNTNVQQIGSTPTCNKVVAAAQAVSENAWFDRNCCGYGCAGAGYPMTNPPLHHGIAGYKGGQIGGNPDTYYKTTVGKVFKNSNKLKDISLHVSGDRFYTEGFSNDIDLKQLQKFLIKNGVPPNKISINIYSTGGNSLKFKKGGSKKKQKGVNGYYLAIEDCPIGGLAVVKGYPDCCPPVFDGSLLRNGGKKTKRKKNKKFQKGGSFKGVELGSPQCSDFNPDMNTREFGCKQPNWGPKCI